MYTSFECGGREFSKRFILKWIGDTGGSNLKMLETATGLEVKILEFLLAELEAEGGIKHDRLVWKKA